MSRTQNRTPRRDAPKWTAKFLKVFAESANISAACRKAKITRSAVYDYKDKHQWFAELYAEADEIAKDAIDEEIHRRAVKGTLRPVFYRGRKVGLIREFSDGLLMFLAKARNPAKYRENAKVVLATEAGSPLEVKGEHDLRVSVTGDDVAAAEAVLGPAPSNA